MGFQCRPEYQGSSVNLTVNYETDRRKPIFIQRKRYADTLLWNLNHVFTINVQHFSRIFAETVEKLLHENIKLKQTNSLLRPLKTNHSKSKFLATA